MREIKFRGKRVDNGEWIVGDLAKYDDVCYIIRENAKAVAGEQAFWFFEVSRESVCQFTGLLDKNGKEIFGGDIVEAWSAGVKAIGRVTQRIDGLWLIYPAWQNERFYYFHPNGNGEDSVEIIGNLWENPELLEVK